MFELQVMHKSLDGFEFGQEVTTDCRVNCPESLKNQCLHFFLVAIDPILFKLACKKDMHKILDDL